MINKYHLLFLLLFSPLTLPAQETYLVYQGKERNFYSEYLQDSITIDLQVPQNVRYAGEGTGYPLLILLDRQNATIYDVNLRAVNFLAGAGAQMPQCLIAGISFRLEDRFRLTSRRKKVGDTQSGIDQTADFLFKELVPALKQDFPGINYLIIAGHSRSGYLVNYLAMTRHQDFDVALSFSGFLEVVGEMEAMCAWGQRAGEGRTYPFYYLFSAGRTPEEKTYREDFDELAACLAKIPQKYEFRWQYFQHQHANHTTNYILSLPRALIELYGEYNAVLNDWLFGKLETVPADSALQVFQHDLATLPYPVFPEPLHFYSLSSHYLNAGKYDVAIDFLEYGLQLYPGEPGFYLYHAEVFLKAGQEEEKKKVLQAFLEVMEKDRSLTPADREELMEWYRSL